MTDVKQTTELHGDRRARVNRLQPPACGSVFYRRAGEYQLVLGVVSVEVTKSFCHVTKSSSSSPVVYATGLGWTQSVTWLVGSVYNVNTFKQH